MDPSVQQMIADGATLFTEGPEKVLAGLIEKLIKKVLANA
jgi:hypothetical protein